MLMHMLILGCEAKIQKNVCAEIFKIHLSDLLSKTLKFFFIVLTKFPQEEESIEYLEKLQDWKNLRDEGAGHPAQGTSLTNDIQTGQSTIEVVKSVIVITSPE